jgi:hypothetical protein
MAKEKSKESKLWWNIGAIAIAVGALAVGVELFDNA